MYIRTSWTMKEFEFCYEIAVANYAVLMIIVFNGSDLKQYPHYINSYERLEAVLAEIEEDKNLDIIAIVEIKDTLEETLASSGVHCSDEVFKEPLWQKVFDCYSCSHCGRKAFIKPFYPYVVGKPMGTCPHCDNYIINDKQQEWVLMSAWGKLRTVTAGLVVSLLHAFMGGLLTGMAGMLIDAAVPYNLDSWSANAILFGAGISLIATLYCRFGVIPASLKRTKNNDYVELLYRLGAAERKAKRTKKKREQLFSWEQFSLSSINANYQLTEDKSEYQYITHLLGDNYYTDGKKVQKYLYSIGIQYSLIGQSDEALWIRQSLPGQGSLLRALSEEYKPEVLAVLPLERTQMPLRMLNRLIILSMEKEAMLEAMEKTCVNLSAHTETDMLAGDSKDELFDIIKLMYHMEEDNSRRFFFTLCIGGIGVDNE